MPVKAKQCVSFDKIRQNSNIAIENIERNDGWLHSAYVSNNEIAASRHLVSENEQKRSFWQHLHECIYRNEWVLQVVLKVEVFTVVICIKTILTNSDSYFVILCSTLACPSNSDPGNSVPLQTMAMPRGKGCCLQHFKGCLPEHFKHTPDWGRRIMQSIQIPSASKSSMPCVRLQFIDNAYPKKHVFESA